MFAAKCPVKILHNCILSFITNICFKKLRMICDVITSFCFPNNSTCITCLTFNYLNKFFFSTCDQFSTLKTSDPSLYFAYRIDMIGLLPSGDKELIIDPAAPILLNKLIII